MKILVCLSKTPDTTSKISFTEDSKKFQTGGIQHIINPFDEWYSLVRAIELKEKDPSIEIHILSVGGADYDPIIRKAFALGGDAGFRINIDSEDPFFVANQIAQFVQSKGMYDILFTGKETIDYNGGMIGAMVATLLKIPSVCNIIKFSVEGTKAIIDREIESGSEKVEVEFPVLVSTQKGVAEARIPNMKGIISSRSKTIEVVEAFPSEIRTETVSFELPPPKSSVKLIDPDNVGELVKLLHEEAKVI